MTASVSTIIKSRPGLFLLIMILTLIVGDVQIPYYVMNADALKTVYAEIPSWYAIYAIIGLASNIAIIIGMWQMKRWAAYLLAAYFASKILVDAFYILPNNRVAVFATTIVGAGFWAWAVIRKWKMFD
jgi:hypothetical protein